MSLARFAGGLLLAAVLPITAFAVQPNTEVEYLYSSPGDDPLNSAVIDVDGNLVIAGARPNNAGATANSYYVAKYDTYGRELWNTSFSNGGSKIEIKVDRDGTIVAALGGGEFGALEIFDADGNDLLHVPAAGLAYWLTPTLRIELGPNQSIYMGRADGVLRYDYSGNLLWSRPFSGTVYDIGLGPDGNFYAVGVTWNAAQSTNNARVTSFDGNGNLRWTQTYGTGASASHLRFDSNGELLVFGTENADLTMRKFTLDGVLLGSASYDFGIPESVVGVDLDENDNAYVLSKAANNIVTSKLDTNGTLQWSNVLAPSSDNYPGAIDVDPLGNVAIVGSSGFNFWSQVMRTVAYDTDGNELWTKQYTTTSLGKFVQIGRTGEVYAGGQEIHYPVGDVFVQRLRLCPCTQCQ